MHYFAAQDESGDLGFDFNKKQTSRHFCITILVSSDRKKIEKIVKRIFADFSMRRIKHRTGVLHAYGETNRTNHLIISRLKEADAMVFIVKVDKTKVTRRDINEFYNDLTIHLLEKIFALTRAEKITLTASRKDTKAALTERFVESLNSAYGDTIAIEVKRPRDSKSLQVVDCVSWGAFRYYESGDDEFYRDIEPILYEYDY
jgi:hypothetical protein